MPDRAAAGSADPASAGAGLGPGEQFPVGDLRHVSMLFVDLVDYTALSESRDAEDVRDLLGRYFERARTIVDRYGGTIEKFIGDAVMAVWGAPVAREDDAERAVRAGLDLVDAVAAFGAEIGAPKLRARAGIATGRVASSANPGEALVIGDRVNTASRVQAAAEPGVVLVDDVTRQVTLASIAYEDAGEHSLKGKAEPLRLWRAARTVAGVAGSQRAAGLEAPFAGRDAELRLIKDLYHACVDRRGARLVGVSGPAGVGKSRLAWEFSKYTDGLADTLLWHSGRCLSYGDGIAYWALAEIVRQRLGIAEDASDGEASAKLAEGVERWITDEAERRRVATALGALIGTDDPGLAREELFAGWRLFFERLSDQDPVVLVFEDMQWADDGLLDFIEQLLEWSGDHPIFVATFARSELAERRQGWPAAVRGATTIVLEPLGDQAISELVEGLVPGLPEPALSRIVDQAEGIPLYGVETIRTLADRGALIQDDGHLEPVGEIGELDVPASLSSLLSARLDALGPDERELVKAMAVFGGSFPRATAAALTAIPDERLDECLAGLVRRDILAIRTDPLSPNRGQYAFAQGLLKTVAYEMIARRERRPLHLAAAEHLRSTFANDGEDVAEVIAAHMLDAYHAGSGEADAEQLRGPTLAALRRAAARAGSVGAPATAERTLRTAIELAADERERLELTEEAGRMALASGAYEPALELFERASAAHEEAGREQEAARLGGKIGLAVARLGRNEEAAERMRGALEVLGVDSVDPATAEITSELASALLFSGRQEDAAEIVDRSLELAEALELPAITCRALNVKALGSMFAGRFEESRALLERAIEIGERHHLSIRVASVINAADLRLKRDVPGAVEVAEAALATAREVGDRGAESLAMGNLMLAQVMVGRWREAELLAAEAIDDPDRPDVESLHYLMALLRLRRGDLESARSHFEGMAAWRQTDHIESHAIYRTVEGLIALESGNAEEASEGLSAIARRSTELEGAGSESTRLAWAEAVKAALAAGRLERADELIALLAERPRGLVPPLLRAELRRAQALVGAARGDHDAVEAPLREAIDDLDDLGYPFWRARAQVDLAAWLEDRGRDEEAAPLIAVAATALGALGAEPELARVRALTSRSAGDGDGETAAREPVALD